MNAPPIIFLAFANDRDRHLSTLQNERAEIFGLLQSHHDAQRIQVHKEENANIDRLLDNFSRYASRIVIFHYGGHADGAALHLESAAGEVEQANAPGLAQLLGQQTSLKLVFLNGCATRPQVELLFAQGVKAVIATLVRVNDTLATEFAQHFYRRLADGGSVQESFDHARSGIVSKRKDMEITQHRGVPERPEDARRVEPAFPWGLYSHPDDDGQVLHWKLPAQVRPGGSPLDEELDCLPFLCNRTKQEQMLIDAIDRRFERRDKRPMLCVLHGRAEEEHDGFLNRISRYSLSDRAQRAPKKMHVIAVMERMPTQGGQDFDKRVFSQLRQFPEFAGVTNHVELSQHLARTRVPIVALAWSVRTTDTIGEACHHLKRLTDFCDKLPDHHPDQLLICIVNIKYETTPAHEGSAWVRSKDRLRLQWANWRMRKAIDKFNGGAAGRVNSLVMDELPKPNRGDVENWAKHPRVKVYVGPYSEGWLKQVLGAAQQMSMDELAGRLKRQLST